MNIDKEHFETYMDRILDRLDGLEKKLNALPSHFINGIYMYDNEDICKLLKVGKRTLQRYRAKGLLPYHQHEGMTYYDMNEIHEFVRKILK